MIEMLLENDEIQQICVNNKIPIIIRTNFIYIQKHQSQETDNGSKVCYSNNFRKKITCHLSQYIYRKKNKLYEFYRLYHMKYLSYRLLQVQQETHQLHHHLELYLHNTQTVNNRCDIEQ